MAREEERIFFKGRPSRLVSLITLICFIFFTNYYAYSLPQGAEVVAGNVSINTSGSNMDINISTDKAITNWQSFSIAQPESVSFHQLSSSSVALNRVVGADPSSILGRLSANGKLFLVNPNGIVFGKTAVVDTAGLIASTLNISDEDFLAGRYIFKGKGGSVINQGYISSPGGYVALLGSSVENSGIIEATLGSIALASGEAITLNLDPQGLIQVVIDEATSQNLEHKTSAVKNTGTLSASGGKVILTAKTLSNIFDKAVNNEGVIEAKSLVNKKGEVYILGEGRASIYNEGTIDVSAEEEGVEGGFIELSAKEKVVLGESFFKLSGWGAKDGVVLIDPDEIDITANQYTDGGDFIQQADEKIEVGENVVISSRKVSSGAGADQEDAASVGDSGDISLTAPQLILKSGAKLLSFADSGFKSGSISLTASDNAGNLGRTASAEITLNNAVLRGGEISLTATAESNDEFSDGDPIVNQVLDFLSDFPVSPAGVSISEAEAAIKIEGNSLIEGSKINLTSTATTSAKVLTASTALGVAYGKSNPTAKVEINDTATLTSQGDIDISSDAEAVSDIEAYTVNLGEGRGAVADLTLAYGSSELEARSEVAPGANISSGGNLNIKARTYKDLKVSALSGAYEDGTLGVGVAISQSNANTNAVLSGHTTANADINVESTSVSERNKTSASSAVGSGGVAGVVVKAANGVINKVESFLDAKQGAPDSRSGGQKVGLSAAFAYAEHTTSSLAEVGDGAEVSAQGKIEVNSKVDYSSGSTKGMQVSAVATVDSNDSNPKQYSVAGAVSISKFENNSKARIGKGAKVSAKKAIRIISNINIPYEITWHRINGVGDITDKLNTNIGIQNGFFTTWAQSNSQGDVVGVAGSVNYFGLTNNSQAYIDEGAEVNQNTSHSGQQEVKVKSIIKSETMNLSGVFGLKGVGVEGGKAGVGGSYLQVNYSNDSEALVKEGVKLYADSLEVKSHTSSRNISIAEAGGTSDTFALNASFSLLNTDNTTLAKVLSGADLEIGNMAVDENEDSSLYLDAEDASQLYNIGGGITKSQNVGIGASVSINEISRDTEAGLAGDVSSSATKIKAENSGQISAWSLAGSLALNGPGPTAAYSSSTDPLDGVTLPALFGNLRAGISVSGDASWNKIDDTTYAYTDNLDLSQAAKLELSAVDESNIDAVSGSVALTSAGATSAGLSASCAVNEIEADTESFAKDSSINTGDASFTAKNQSEIKTVSASGTGACSAAGSSGSVAGSVSVNKINNTTQSFLDNTSLISSSNLSLSSSDSSQIRSIAAATSLGGKAAFGASVAYNEIGGSLSTYFLNSYVQAADISLTSEADSDIRSLSASADMGVDKDASLAASASVSLNVIDRDIASYIEGKKNAQADSAEAAGDIDISAISNSVIKSLAGQLTVSTGVGVGGSAAYNEIEGNVKSYSHQTDLNSSGGNITLASKAQRDIETVAAGGAGAAGLGFAGSTVINDISGEIFSYADDSSLRAFGSALILAQSQDAVTSYAGAVAGSSNLGLGGAAVINLIENEISSYIKKSRLDTEARKSISDVPKADGSGAQESLYGAGVLAISKEEVKTYTGTASLGNYALAASMSLNSFKDNTSAYIDNSSLNQNNNNPSSSQAVKVEALNTTDSQVLAGGLTFSASSGAGGSADREISGNITQAYIKDSQVSSISDTEVRAKEEEYINAKVVSGSGAGTAAVAGSVEVITTANTTSAYIEGSVVKSGSSLKVLSQDAVYLGVSKDESRPGVLVGSLSIGGVAGVGGSVLINKISEDNSAYIRDSSADVGGLLQVKAESFADELSYAASGSLGLYLAAGGGVIINSFSSSTRSFIDEDSSSTQINKNFFSPGQSVEVKAKDTVKMEDKAGTITASGYTGVGGSIDVARVDNTAEAFVGDGVEVSAQKDIGIEAESEKHVSSAVMAFAGGLAAGVAGAVSLVNVGGSIGQDGKDAAKNTQDKSQEQIGKSNSVDAALSNDSRTQSVAAKAKQNSSFSLNSEFDQNNPAQANVAAFSGTSSLLSAGGNINIEAKDKININIVSGSAGAGIIGVGGGVGLLNLNLGTVAFAGSNCRLSAGGDISIEARNEIEKAEVDAYAGSGGLISLGAAVALISLSQSTEAYLGWGAWVEEADEVNITALNKNKLEAEAKGASVGGAVAGLSEAAAEENDSVTHAFLAEGAKVGDAVSPLDVGGLKILAKSDSDLSASSFASSGGIINGSGSVARAESSPEVKGEILNNASVHIQGPLDLKSLAIGNIYSKAEGINVGGITVGISDAFSRWQPDIYAGTPAVAFISAGSAGNVNIWAGNNYDEYGNKLSNKKVEAKAFSATGSLIGGVGSKAEALADSSTKAEFGTKLANLSAYDVDIETFSFNNTDASASGHAYGVAAGGFTQAESKVFSHTTAAGKDNIKAQRDVTIYAYSDDNANSYVTGGEGGLLTDSGTKALSLINTSTEAQVYPWAYIAAGRDITVVALAYIWAKSYATTTSLGAITWNQTEADTEITANVDSFIGAHAKLEAERDADIEAKIGSLYGEANAYSKTTAADSTSEAIAKVDIEADTTAVVDEYADITGKEHIYVRALQNTATLKSISKAEIKAGLTGTVKAKSSGNINLNSHVDIRHNTNLRSRHIELKASSARGGNLNINRDATAKGNTVVNWVLETVDVLVKAISHIPIIGWFVKWIWKKVKKWVKHILHSDESAITEGEQTSSNSINMDGRLWQLSSQNQLLQVDAGGNIIAQGDISGQINGNNIEVNDLINAHKGSIILDAAGGSITGEGEFYVNNTYPRVDIINNSSYNLLLHNIKVTAEDINEPNYTLICDPGKDTSHFTIHSYIDSHSVNIVNNGRSQIILAGYIDNNFGDMTLINNGGGIELYSPANPSIRTGTLVLEARQGAIGSRAGFLPLVFLKDNNAPTLEVHANFGAYLDIALEENKDAAPAAGYIIDSLFLEKVLTGQEARVNFGYGKVYYTTQDADGNDIKTDVSCRAKYAIGQFYAGGHINWEAALKGGLPAVYLDISGEVKAGFKDINFGIDAFGNITASDIDYIDEIGPDYIKIDPLRIANGGIDANNFFQISGAGSITSLNGYGKIKVVSDYEKTLWVSDVLSKRVDGVLRIDGVPIYGGTYNGIGIFSYGYEEGEVSFITHNASLRSGNVLLEGANDLSGVSAADIELAGLNSSQRKITLEAGGKIYDWLDTAAVDIGGLEVYLEAENGIGPQKAIDTVIVDLSAFNNNRGAIRIDNYGNILLRRIINKNGNINIAAHSDMRLGYVEAVGSVVELTAEEGSILNSGLEAVNVNAAIANFIAKNNIGTSAMPLSTSLRKLAAISYDEGSLYISNRGFLEAGYEKEGIGYSIMANHGIIRIENDIDMVVNSVLSPRGGVYLESKSGSLFAGKAWCAANAAEEKYAVSLEATPWISPVVSNLYYKSYPQDLTSFNVLAGGLSYFSAPQGTIGVGYAVEQGRDKGADPVFNPLRVNIRAFTNQSAQGVVPDYPFSQGGLVIFAGGTYPGMKVDTGKGNGTLGISGLIEGDICPSATTNIYPSVGIDISKGTIPGYVFYYYRGRGANLCFLRDTPNLGGVYIAIYQAWPPFPFAALIASLRKGFNAYYGVLAPSQFLSYYPSAKTGLYAYHPLTPTDTSAFDDIRLDVGAYEFIENSLKLKDKNKFYQYYEDQEKKKKRKRKTAFYQQSLPPSPAPS